MRLGGGRGTPRAPVRPRTGPARPCRIRLVTASLSPRPPAADPVDTTVRLGAATHGPLALRPQAGRDAAPRDEGGRSAPPRAGPAAAHEPRRGGGDRCRHLREHGGGGAADRGAR